MFVDSIDRGPVRWLTLNNPGRRNAIPPDGWDSLTKAFSDFESSSQRVLVVIGQDGDFCSGAELAGGDSEASASIAGQVGRMKVVGAAALALRRITKPTIAAVDGVAAGAGLNLAIGCDVVLATTRARFSEIFVQRGLTVDFGGTWHLPRIVGLQRAKEMVLSGRIVEAAEAKEIGLVLDLVEVNELTDAAQELAESFASGAPIAQMFAKRTVDRSFELSFEEALEAEHQAQVICFSTEDVTEGVTSFLEKRPPSFKGR